MLPCVKAPSRWARAINRLLLELNATIGDVAEKGEVSRQNLGDILNGKVVPGADMLEAIAKGFGVDMVQLLCTEEQARILREHHADAARLREEVASLGKRVEEQVADLRKLVEERMAAPSASGTVKEPNQEKSASAKLSRAGAKDTRKRPRAR
jgi:transcriptional regulator with XRE-family HTH domain